MKPKLILNDFVYWKLERPAQRLFYTVIWKLPRNVIYWSVVRAATAVEPDNYPGDVTAKEMLKYWSDDAER